ncbi:MAG: hypothetical protein AVDCRST_MAG68-1102, partial [uncultured Gemmatimonadetes bacterium]
RRFRQPLFFQLPRRPSRGEHVEYKGDSSLRQEM